MKNSLFAFLVVLALSTACTDREAASAFREYDVQGKLYEPEIFAQFPRIIGMDSLLIVFSLMGPDKLVTIYSPRENMKKVASFGRQGRGPGEYFALEINSTHNNRFFARNMNMQELVIGEVVKQADSIEVKEVERLKFERILYDDMGFEDRDVSYFDERHYVAVSYGGAGKFFSLYDNRMNWLAHFGDGPVEQEIEQSDARRNLDGLLTTHNGVFAYAPMRLPKVQFYKMHGPVPQKEWEDTFYNSFYSVSNKRIGFDDDRTVGMVLDLKMGEKYVYILFLDVPLAKADMSRTETSAANIVFVYDHGGNRVARLNLDYRINRFCVSTDEKTMYALAPTPEDRIVSFNLPAFEGN